MFDEIRTKVFHLYSFLDAKSSLYTIGDLVDMRDMEQGAWFEGKIARIVYDPTIPHATEPASNKQPESENLKPSSDKESDSENNPPVEASSPENKSKKKGIAKYFTKSPKSVKKKPIEKDVRVENTGKVSDADLLFKVQLDSE